MQPAKALLEPANEQTSRTERTGGDGDGGGDDAPSGKVVAPWPGKVSVGGVYGDARGREPYARRRRLSACRAGPTCIAPFDGTITHVSTSGFGSGGGMIHLRAAADVGTHVKQGRQNRLGHIRVSARVNGGAKGQGRAPDRHVGQLRHGAATSISCS